MKLPRTANLLSLLLATGLAFSGCGSSTTDTIISGPTPLGPGYFVDSRTGNDSTGNFQNGAPFATVQAAVAAAGPGADILIRPGSGVYEGQIQLLDDQRLLGNGSVDVSAQGLSLPTLSGPILLADNNTVDSIQVIGTDGIAIDGDDQDSGTITNCDISDNQNGTGIQMRAVTGQWRVEDNNITRIDGIGLDMDTQAGGTARVQANRNLITECRLFGLGMAAFGQSDMRMQANNNTLSGNGHGFGPDQTALGSLCASQGMATITIQLIGNINNGIYGFTQAAPDSTINVERFAQINDLNEGNFVEIEGTVSDVPLGTAGF